MLWPRSSTPWTLTRLSRATRVAGAPTLALDVALLAFAIQHSVMARPAIQAVVDARHSSLSRARQLYVLASIVALALVIWQWRPLGGIVWEVQDGWARALLHVIGAAGWLIVLASALLIDGLELIGVRQMWAHWRGVAPARRPS